MKRKQYNHQSILTSVFKQNYNQYQTVYLDKGHCGSLYIIQTLTIVYRYTVHHCCEFITGRWQPYENSEQLYWEISKQFPKSFKLWVLKGILFNNLDVITCRSTRMEVQPYSDLLINNTYLLCTITCTYMACTVISHCDDSGGYWRWSQE